jgi:hypothetical protein
LLHRDASAFSRFASTGSRVLRLNFFSRLPSARAIERRVRLVSLVKYGAPMLRGDRTAREASGPVCRFA